MTFLLSPLQQLLHTSQTRYLIEFRARTCIFDEQLRPENGDTVLLDISGTGEWASVWLYPWRIITDEGQVLDEDLLEDVTVVGVVTHEVTPVPVGNEVPF